MTNQKISIIILNWNKLEYLRNCIESLDENTDYPHFEIIIFDNGSTEPGTREYLSSLAHKVIFSKKNLGFAMGNNKAASETDADLLLFLNNDIVAHKNWLAPMVRLMEDYPDIGIAGSKLLYPDGSIQHIGTIFDHKGIAQNMFKRYPADIPEAVSERECEAVIGACMLIKRDIFLKTGGFDERYMNGFEDIDLCLKVRELGFRVFFCPDSVLTHFEKTTTDASGIKLKRKMTRHNQKVFLSTWKEKLDSFRLSKDLSGLKPYKYYNHVRKDILDLIPPGPHRILDVGCAHGALCKAMKDVGKASYVCGIELNETAVSRAGQHLDKVLIADIEKEATPFDGEEKFDYIILADILEHLRDPWNTLKKFTTYLSDSGRVICSIPNIRHHSMIKDILLDRWLYREAGVLDIDHIRFFSLSTAKDMFGVAGLNIEKIKRNKKANKFLRYINMLCLNKLADFLTIQYLFVCSKRKKDIST
ncbi:MAG: bifunctional glycosyltransferase family 2 protein/class I SAM-dependent methyltransferase [Nitrospirota bacterium]